MKELIFMAYETPQVEIIEVQVEQGFATSGTTKGFGESGGTWEDEC